MHLARRNRDLPTNDRKAETGCKSFRRNGDCRPRRSVAVFSERFDRARRLHCKIDNSSGEMPKQTHTSRSPTNGVSFVMRTILLIILILLLIGAFPAWPYSSGWGYYPSGGIGIILLIVLILALTGRI